MAPSLNALRTRHPFIIELLFFDHRCSTPKTSSVCPSPWCRWWWLETWRLLRSPNLRRCSRGQGFEYDLEDLTELTRGRSSERSWSDSRENSNSTGFLHRILSKYESVTSHNYIYLFFLPFSTSNKLCTANGVSINFIDYFIFMSDWSSCINDTFVRNSKIVDETILFVFNGHLPIHTKNISNCGKSKPCITPGILAAICRKRRLEKKARENPERFLTEYRRDRNLLTKVTRTAREQYYHNLLESSFRNSKKVWSNINTILGKNCKSSSTSIQLNGIIINEPKVIASSFNSYFNSIPTTLSNNINNNILTFKNCLVDQIPEA